MAGRFRAGPAGWSGDEEPWTPLLITDRKSKNIAGISNFLSEILRMSPDVVDLVVGSGGSGFGGGNPPTEPKGSGSVGGDPQSTVGLVGSGGGRSVSGGSGGLVG